MTRKILLLFFLFTCTLFSYSEEPAVEEAYVFIRVNNKFGDPFFMVYIEKEGEKIYVPLKAFLSFSEINTLEINEEERLVLGSVLTKGHLDHIKEEQFLRSYEKEDYFTKDEDIFVELQSLKGVLNLRDLYWDETRSFLDIHLNYLLYFEVRELQEEFKSNLLSDKKAEEKIIIPERKIFSPGVLRLEYFLSDFDDRDNQTLTALYNTQLLYGDFSLQTRLHPETKLNHISLKYRDKIKDKIIILGDSTLEKDSSVKVEDSTIRGLTITSNEVYTEVDSGKISISGQVPNGTTVELYQTGILIDLQIVTTSNEYNFEDIILFWNDKFTLKFYYPNGRMEIRDLNIYDDFEIQGKGKNDYRIQLGESSNSLTLSTKYLYGITENITAGIGYLKAGYEEIGEDLLTETSLDADNEYNIAEGTLILRSRLSKNPALLKLSWLHDIDDGSDATFKGKLKKQLWFLNTEFYYDDYSDELSLVREEDKRYGVILGSNFPKFSYSLEYEIREFLDTEEEIYRLNTRHYLNKNTRLELNGSYTKPEDREKEYNILLSLDYSGFNSINLNLLVQNTYSNGEWEDEEYAVRVSNKSRASGKGDLDYSLEASYSDEEWKFTAYLTYYLRDWLSFPARFTEEDQEVGIAAEKTIILSKLFEKNGNPEPYESWIEGKVFKDDNGNGKMDPGETPFEGVDILAEGSVATTQKDGSYYIDGIQGNRPVEIAPTGKSIDPLLKFSEEKYTLIPISATGHTVNIPLLPVTLITGDITFNSETISKAPNSTALQQVKIYVKDGDEIIASNTAEYDGFFIVEDILPGEYTVEAKYLGGEEYEIKTHFYQLKVENEESGNFYEGFNFELIDSKEHKKSKINKPSNL